MKEISYGDIIRFKGDAPDEVTLITSIGETAFGAGRIRWVGPEYEEMSGQGTHRVEEVGEVIERWPFARIVNAITNYWTHGATSEQRAEWYKKVFDLQVYDAEHSFPKEIDL